NAEGSSKAPAAFPPVVQFGIEGKIGFVDHLHELPGHRTEEDAQADPFLLELVSHQHPDHETKAWPPKELR
ncbi:GFA family protein, partial [Rhizobium ruizarguesonis]